MVHRVVTLVRRIVTLVRRVVTLVRRTVTPVRRVVTLVRRVVTPVRRVLSDSQPDRLHAGNLRDAAVREEFSRCAAHQHRVGDPGHHSRPRSRLRRHHVGAARAGWGGQWAVSGAVRVCCGPAGFGVGSDVWYADGGLMSSSHQAIM